MAGLGADLRYAFRSLRSTPVFTLVATASLALGIGANTALFSLVDALLLRKLPVADPDGLYQLTATHRTGTDNRFSYPAFEKLREQTDLFAGVFAWRHATFRMEIDGREEEVTLALASGEYFPVLGVRAELGRLLTPDDDTGAGSGAVVISHRLWERRFARDPNVIGRTIRVEKVPLTIAGVAPPEFSGAEPGDYPEITLPVHTVNRLNPEQRWLRQSNFHVLHVMARLKPGVAPARVESALQTIWPRLMEAEGPAPADGWTPRIHVEPGATGYSEVRAEFSYALLLLMGLVALVLLIACANIANLLLTRGAARRREIAVRLAMGASRLRLLRQWLIESLALAAAGGAAGLIVARWTAQGLLLFLPPGSAAGFDLAPNARVLAFTALLTVLTALLFGLIPALRATRVPPGFVLKETGRGFDGARRGWLSRSAVIAQIAFSLTLIAAAGLLARSLSALTNQDAGFHRENLLTVRTDTNAAGYRGARASEFHRAFLQRLSEIRGVESASLSSLTPLAGGAWWDPAEVPGYTPGPNESTTVFLNAVSPRYFETLGTPLVAGRDFTDRDQTGAPRVAIVNESFARKFFGGADAALGKTFSVARNPDMQNLRIAGVARNSRYSSLREGQRDQVFLALFQFPEVSGVFAVRIASNARAADVSAGIRAAAQGVRVEAERFDEQVLRSLRQDRMVAMLSGCFGLLGLALAAMGLYGIMAYSVTCRTGEIGVRMALGAGQGAVARMVLRETILLASLGAAAGIPATLAASRLIAARLFGVSAWDPLTLAASTLTILATAALAGYIPARRASAVDPTVALRAE